jgi:hypothetical protein
MADNRNPFATVFSYTPLGAAAGYAGWEIYKDLKANHAQGTAESASTLLTKSAERIKNEQAANKALALGRIGGGREGTRRLVSQALAGASSPDVMRRITFAYAASVMDPGSNLTKVQMHEALRGSFNLVQAGKADTSAYISGMGNLFDRMSTQRQQTFLRNFHQLGRTSTTDRLLGMEGRHRQSMLKRGVPEGSGWARLGFFGMGDAPALPTNMSRTAITTPADIDNIFKQLGVSSDIFGKQTQVEMFKLQRGATGYTEMNINFAGRGDPFRFILPDTAGGGGPTKLLSPKFFSPYTVGNIQGGGGAWSALGEGVKQVAGAAPGQRRGLYNQLQQDLFRVGHFTQQGASSGQLLLEAFQRNTVYDPRALAPNAHYSSEQMLEFMGGAAKKGTTLGMYSPGRLTGGGFVNMGHFKLGRGGGEFDLTKLRHGQADFDKSNRLFQMVRDLSYNPTESERKKWNLKSATGAHTSYGLDPASVRGVRMGASGALGRLIPVQATGVWDDLLVKNFGYITPNAVAMSALGQNSEAALERWGIGDGERLITKDFARRLRSSRAKTVRVSAAAGAPGFLIGEAGGAFKAGSLSPTQYVAELNKQIAAAGPGGLRLERGAELGVGVGGASGRVVRSMNQAGLIESVIGAELIDDSLSLTVREDISMVVDKLDEKGKIISSRVTTEAKGFLEKARLKVVDQTYLRNVISHTLFNTSWNELKKTKQAAKIADIAHIESFGFTSSGEKHVAGLADQMISGLRQMVGREIEMGATNPALRTFLDDPDGIKALYNQALPAGGGTKSERIAGLTKTIAGKVTSLGLGQRAGMGAIFGGALTMGQKAAKAEGLGAGYLRPLREAVFGAVGAAGYRQARRGMTVGESTAFIGDYPWMAQGKQASVEMRNISMLLSAAENAPEGARALMQGAVADVYGGVASPAARADYEAMTKLRGSMTGKITPGAGEKVLELTSQNLEDITQMSWFGKEGAWISHPQEAHAALKAQGLSTQWYVPGEQAVSTFGGQEGLPKAGHARTRGGDLVAKTYREGVQDMFSGLGRSGGYAAASGMADSMLLQAQKGLVRGALGTGSSYAEASGLGVVREGHGFTMHGPAMAQEGLGHMVGGKFASHLPKSQFTEETVFISRKLALRMVGQLEEAGMFGAGASMAELAGQKEAFLRGEVAWGGMVGRQPAATQQSLQPARIAVHQGSTTSTVENIKIAKLTVQRVINGNAVNIPAGLAPGLGADVDGDQLFVKLFQDRGAIKAAQDPQQWAAYRSYRIKQAGIKSVLDERVIQNMSRHYKATPPGTMGLSAAARQTFLSWVGKDVGAPSRTFQELRFALQSDARLSSETRGAFTSLLSSVEEAGTLKAKHLPFAAAPAQELTAALYGPKGVEFKPTRFLSKLQEMAWSGGDETISMGLHEGGRTHQAEFKMGQAQFEEIAGGLERYGNEQVRRDAFSLTRRTNPRMGPERRAAAMSWMEANPGKVPEVGLGQGMGPGRKGMAGVAEGMIGMVNEAWKSGKGMARKYPRQLGGVVLAGMAGTAILQGLSGGPGYAAQPLGVARGVDPSLLDQVKQGTALEMQEMPRRGTGGVSPGSVGSQNMGGGPQVTGQLTTPVARISSNNGSLQAHARGDLSQANIDRALSQFRHTVPGAQTRAQVVDRRHPLYPTMLDRD